MTKLLIRDGHSAINGDLSTTEMPSGSLDIIAPDGRPLYTITMLKGGVIEVSSSSIVKIDGILLDSKMHIAPRASNLIEITRPEYK